MRLFRNKNIVTLFLCIGFSIESISAVYEESNQSKVAYQAPILPYDVVRIIACKVLEKDLYKDVQCYLHDVKQSLRSFACTNKQMHLMLNDLLYGNNHQAKWFNDELIARSAEICCSTCQPTDIFEAKKKLVAAYIGTPAALATIKSDLELLPVDKVKVLLDAGIKTEHVNETVYGYDGPPGRMIPDFSTRSVETKVVKRFETFDELLKKFPQSTRKFCMDIVQRRQLL